MCVPNSLKCFESPNTIFISLPEVLSPFFKILTLFAFICQYSLAVSFVFTYLMSFCPFRNFKLQNLLTCSFQPAV